MKASSTWPWTPEEDSQLRQILAEGQGAKLASVKLQRSIASVKTRAQRLGLSIKPRKSLGVRAAELAADVIDSRMAAHATTEERETRKRRLVKGPSSFRDVRKDHPK
jgi:hypothetical protein